MFAAFLLSLITVVFLIYRHQNSGILLWLSVLLMIATLLSYHATDPLPLNF